jgi:hypothetical protein
MQKLRNQLINENELDNSIILFFNFRNMSEKLL